MAKGVAAAKVDEVLQELITRLTNGGIKRVKKEVQFFDAEGCRMSIFRGDMDDLLGFTEWASFLSINDVCSVQFSPPSGKIWGYIKDNSNIWRREFSRASGSKGEKMTETPCVIAIDGTVRDKVFNTLDAAKAAGKAAIEHIEPDEDDEDATIEIEVQIFQLVTTIRVKKEVVVTVIEEN